MIVTASRTSLALGLLAGVAIAGSGYAKEAPKTELALATPAGITLQPLGKAQGYSLDKETASHAPRDQIVYADAKGLTVYTYELDAPGKSNCTGDCTKQWKPVPVPAGAQASGDWSVITRDDGAKQWALKGMPLYHFVEDVDPGSISGNSPARFGAGRIDGAGNPIGGGSRGNLRGAKVKPDTVIPKEWKAAYFYPRSDFKLPPQIGIRETFDAQAVALVDYKERTLYTFDGDQAALKQVNARVWAPAEAPQLVDKVGDFAFIQRDDGIKQWTYKGKALYTYADDRQTGDAYGEGADGKWHAAAITKFYLPEGITMQKTLGFGKVMATAQGKTLYKREGYINQSGGGHSFRDGNPNRPAVGRDIGTDPHCGECGGVWHPYLADANAQPRGYFDVLTRADGAKQWAYKGFALWIYDGDKKPGDMNGHDATDVVVSLDPKTVVNVGTPQDAAASLAWAIVLP